ncbi:hypothetical protein KUL154_08960 [Alteromonas sp. KUL154]|nr:hypothetical protein KUL154_08960 [Alteromonas sp. KUL154]
MTDLIKVRVNDLAIIKQLYSNPKLKTNSLSKYKNIYKESFNKKEAKIYNGMLFLFKGAENDEKLKYLDILIKPHYYYNNYKHNSNDFTVYDFNYVISEILDDLEIYELDKFKVINLEYGLNFTLENYGKELILYTEYWRRTKGVVDNEYKYSKKFSGTKSNGKFYFYKMLKFYCKGVQEGVECDEETLRFEIKSMESKYINTLGIYNIGDFLDLNVYDKMREEILKAVKELLIIDSSINVNKVLGLSKREENKLLEYLNPHVWHKIVYEQERTSFNYKKVRYFKLLNKTGFNVHLELYNIVEEKLDFLINYAPTFEEETSTYSTGKYDNETSTYSNINIVGMYNKECSVTGLDISMQKDCSLMLSVIGVRYYYKYYPRIFDRLKNRHLPKKWINSSLENQFYRIAHNIRDVDRNRRVKQEKLYSFNQYTLFDLSIERISTIYL